MATVRVRFDVFVASEKAYEMSGYMLGYSAGANHRYERPSKAKPFRAPAFMYAGTGTFRHPRPFADAAAKRAIETAKGRYVVTYEGERQDSLWYLDAAIALAEDIAKQRKGVVVDATADMFFSKSALAALRKGISARDTVSLREDEDEKRGAVTLTTCGMSKFGQQDFVLTAFPSDLAEMGRRLLYDNLCSYSIGRAILAGQTFGGTTVRMIFVDAGGGTLEVRDVHAEKKEALAGTDQLVAALRPIWAAQAALEAKKAKPRAKARPKPKSKATSKPKPKRQPKPKKR